MSIAHPQTQGSLPPQISCNLLPLISLELRTRRADWHPSLRLVAHLHDQPHSHGDCQNQSQHQPEEQVELDRDIDLVAGWAPVLGGVDLHALAVVAVGRGAQHTPATLVAAVGVGLAFGLGHEARAAGGQGALHLVGVVGALFLGGGSFGSKHLGALASGGCDHKDSGGVGLVDLLKLWDESLSRGESKKSGGHKKK